MSKHMRSNSALLSDAYLAPRASFGAANREHYAAHNHILILHTGGVEEMNAPELRIGQLGIRYILDGSTTNSLGIFELTVPSGSNVPPPHSHARNEECVYVLEGKLRYTVGATSRDLGPGEAMQTPKGTV